jgi:hypothetical protein
MKKENKTNNNLQNITLKTVKATRILHKKKPTKIKIKTSTK